MSRFNKIAIGIIAGATAVLLIIAGIYVANKIAVDRENKNIYAQHSKYVVVAVERAQLGSRIAVFFTKEGQTKYAAAKKYQIHTGNKPISARVSLSNLTTIVPAHDDGDKVDLKLYDEKDKEVASMTVVLQKMKTGG